MAVSIAQKVDLLYKQAFGVTKTDTETNKSPSNENIPSPLLMRGDTIWMSSDQIPTTATPVANVVSAYVGGSAPNLAPIQCVPDTTTVPVSGVYPTWKTNLTDWIPVEFGSTYNIKIYVDNAGAANPASTGTQLFAAGSGGTGEYYFNYVSGVLNFIGGTIPAALTSGKVLYAVGYRYVGPKGITNNPGNVNLGNLNITDTTISSLTTDSNIILSPNGNGVVVITSGLNATDLTTSGNLNVLGNATFANLDLGNLSSNGNISAASLSSNTLSVSGTANVGDLNSTGSIAANGNISGANILSSGDITANGNIYGDNLSLTANANVGGDAYVGGDANIAGDFGVQGFVFTNLIPSLNETYTLGNSTHRWKDIYLAGNSIILGNTTISSTGNDIFTTANANVTGELVANAGRFTGNVLMDKNLTVAGNLTVSGNTTYINVTDLNVSDPIIELGGTANGGNASTYDGKDRGLFLHNFDANTNSPVNQFIGWKSGANRFEISADTSITNGLVTVNEYGNIKGNVFIGNLDGQVLQSNQSIITQVGNLVGLTVNGNAVVSGKITTGAIIAGNITYPVADGSNGQVLRTDGNGVLSFATIDTYKIGNGSSNVYVYTDGNVVTTANGSATFTVTETSVEVVGDANISGTAQVGQLSTTSIELGLTNVKWANLTTTSTNVNQVIVSLDANSMRGAEFFVRGVNATEGYYCVATIQAVHSGPGANADVDFNNHGTVVKGGVPGYLSVIWNSGNIELVVTPASSNSTEWTTQYRTI